MSFSLSDYLPVLLMFVVAAGFAVTFITLSQLVGQRKRTRTKLMPYECGMDPVGSAHERFSVKFYLIAMIAAGLIYVIKKGAFDWTESARREAQAEGQVLEHTKVSSSKFQVSSSGS